MARMTAAEAAVWVLKKEGVDTAFGVPGAAINPLVRRPARTPEIATSWRGTWKAPRTWPRATPVPAPATSACASAPPARPAPT
jgi:hypothetical protein